ncbi:sulfotransferase [Pseudoponticoccus marisrubri]|uniref:sulfotransferase n=1 Tax=Pseudoponticoccus marisrubri TaxID=1685382 RepID=UPI000A0692BB|nr:sulfotransferase [Pseudoponticoccus marisrubri]
MAGPLSEIHCPEFSSSKGLLICIGAQKSGTSWLYRQLVNCPEVASESKELHYWSRRRAPYIDWDKMGYTDPKIKKDGRSKMFQAPPSDHSAYARYVSRGAVAGSLLLDFSPAYALCGSRTFEEMSLLHSNTLFLFMMRDPVDRLWSGIRHRHKRLFRHGVVSKNDVIRMFENSLHDDYDPDYRRSRYDVTLDRLRRVIPAERVLLVNFCDLFDSGLAKVKRFVGLEASESCPTGPINEGIARDWELPDELAEMAFERLQMVYEKVETVIGHRPKGWRGANEDTSLSEEKARFDEELT